MNNTTIDPRDRVAHEILKAFWREHLQYGGPRSPVDAEEAARICALIESLHDEDLKRSTLGRFRQNGMPTLPAPTGGRGRFRLPYQEDGDDGFNGYTVGETWNGWACPRLPREGVEKLIRDVKDETIEFEFRGDVLWQRYETEWSEAANPFYLNTVDGEILVYDVGLGLCWDQVETKEDR